MKRGWVVLLLLAGLAAPRAAQAQASVYGEFSAGNFTNLLGTTYRYGGTTGLLYDGPTIFHHIIVTADIEGRFVVKNGDYFNSGTLGPRFQVPMSHGFSPYGEFLVGFARYKSSNTGCTCYTGASGTTDGTIQVNGGVAKRLSRHFDAVIDFSYAQYYAFGGQFNPKTISGGAIYHFKKRDEEVLHRVPYTAPLPGDVKQ